MKLEYTDKFLKTLAVLPSPIRKTFYKQAQFLAQNLRYPSLRSKKYDEANDIWQARINKDWRFFFKIEGDIYSLVSIGPHPQ
ncbi:MAG: hypothetical protein V1704_03990 [Candidatus Vogelbacteria bacterium]